MKSRLENKIEIEELKLNKYTAATPIKNIIYEIKFGEMFVFDIIPVKYAETYLVKKL